MCIGTPMKIIRCEHGMAVAEGRGQTERLNMLMVGELPPGTWVLAFQGSALRVISAEEAARPTPRSTPWPRCWPAATTPTRTSVT